jgi:putative membrane protein
MLKVILAGTAILLTTTACNTMNTDAGDDGMSHSNMNHSDSRMANMTMPTTAAGYVPMAAASDQFEIRSSQMALQKSQNADVRRYAQMMIDHHTRTTQQLAAAARSAGITPPANPPMPPMVANMLRDLEGKSGAAFDRAYVMHQVHSHEMALNLHRTYAERGDRAELRTVASAAVPIVTQHLEDARRMHSAMM